MSYAARDWSGWAKEGCCSELPTCWTGSRVMVLLVWPCLHLEITSVGRELSQTCSNPARKAPSDVNRLRSKSHSTGGEALLLLFISQPGPSLSMCACLVFSVPVFPHACCRVGIKLMQLLVAGLDVGLLLATLLPVLWCGEHKVKASSCQRQTGAAV